MLKSPETLFGGRSNPTSPILATSLANDKRINDLENKLNVMSEHITEILKALNSKKTKRSKKKDTKGISLSSAKTPGALLGLGNNDDDDHDDSSSSSNSESTGNSVVSIPKNANRRNSQALNENLREDKRRRDDSNRQNNVVVHAVKFVAGKQWDSVFITPLSLARCKDEINLHYLNQHAETVRPFALFSNKAQRYVLDRLSFLSQEVGIIPSRFTPTNGIIDYESEIKKMQGIKALEFISMIFRQPTATLFEDNFKSWGAMVVYEFLNKKTILKNLNDFNSSLFTVALKEIVKQLRDLYKIMTVEIRKAVVPPYKKNETEKLIGMRKLVAQDLLPDVLYRFLLKEVAGRQPYVEGKDILTLLDDILVSQEEFQKIEANARDCIQRNMELAKQLSVLLNKLRGTKAEWNSFQGFSASCAYFIVFRWQ